MPRRPSKRQEKSPDRPTPNKADPDRAVADSDLDQSWDAAEAMVDPHQVLYAGPEQAALPPLGNEMIGKIHVHKRGFGFIVPDSPTEHGDLFVPAGRTEGAMTGDHVRARVIKESRGPRGRGKSGKSPYIGQVVEIIQRADKHYVGNLSKRGQLWIAKVDGGVIRDPVIIRDAHAKNAREGDKVLIELIEYPEDDQPGEGVIIKVLGESGLPDVETQAVMHTYGLVDAFPAQVLEDARIAARGFDAQAIPPEREDLTNKLICTIDPPDAKDYDDAINIDKLDADVEKDGAAYELGVHIADVSHFVTSGTELDQEAYQRGNSAYLPRKVVPMLPELLSNGVCSLQEGVNRFCESAFIRYDAKGHVISQRFARTVIRSAKRLTYLEAQALIDGDLREARKHTAGTAKYPSGLIDMVKLMDELAKLLRKRRLASGMIVLALPDVELVYDDAGYVIDAVPEDEAFTHKIIEMFMVEANEAVARLFDSLNVPMIRRVHPDPDAGNLGDLRRYARVAGYNIPEKPTRTELQNLLDAVRGKPAQWAVHMAVLKTLSKAEYAPSPIGHFALASTHYTHFTSPIRRYPDLIVHRALGAYLELKTAAPGSTSGGGKSGQRIGEKLKDDPRCPDEQTLIKAGRHCSTTERNAESAERDLRTFLVLELLSNHLGEDFEGTVTGVASTGVYVRLDKYLVEGFISVSDLPSSRQGDRWRFNRDTGAMVAQRSGKTISISNRFTVRIAAINPAARVMELAIIKNNTPQDQPKPKPNLKAKTNPNPNSNPKSKKFSQPRGGNKAHQNTMKGQPQKNKGRGRRGGR